MGFFDPDDCNRPVDSQARLRTTRLCLNRILEEPNVASIIGSYYKGILADDAWMRMSYILQQLREAEYLNAYMQDRIQELNGYLEYYFDHTWIMTMVMVVLARSQWSSPKVRATVVMALFDVFYRATQAHRTENVLCYVQFLHGNFDDPDTESRDTTGPFTDWNVTFFERLFDSRAMELALHMAEHAETYCHLPSHQHQPSMPRLVAGTIRDVVFVPAVYLSNHPTNRHFDAYLSRLFAATRLMNQKIAELSPDDSDYEEEEEDDDEDDGLAEET